MFCDLERALKSGIDFRSIFSRLIHPLQKQISHRLYRSHLLEDVYICIRSPRAFPSALESSKNQGSNHRRRLYPSEILLERASSTKSLLSFLLSQYA